MAAQSLHCPNCGAAASSEATRCEHCHSRLATVACPACFGMMFLGAKFCSHCGAPAQREEVPTDRVKTCPRCRAAMQTVLIGKNKLRECPRCEGLWADETTVRRICADQEQQAAVLGVAGSVPTPVDVPLETVRYVPCPVCGQLMHRVNFARCSHVVVDVCKPHGTWFDKDELRRIVEFIQAGGFDKARALDLARMERERRALEAERRATEREAGSRRGNYHYDRREGALAAALVSVLDGW